MGPLWHWGGGVGGVLMGRGVSCGALGGGMRQRGSSQWGYMWGRGNAGQRSYGGGY